MATYETIDGNSVSHCHIGVPPCAASEYTLAERQESREQLLALFPNYEEVRAPSRKYNCHGYALARGHGWFNEPELLIDEDFFEVPMDEARRGDVLVYQDDALQFTHSAFVKKVKDGEIQLLRSKMGKSCAVLHEPLDVDESYGQPAFLLRRRRVVS